MQHNSVKLSARLREDPVVRTIRDGEGVMGRLWLQFLRPDWERTGSITAVTFDEGVVDKLAGLSKGCEVVVTGALDLNSWKPENGPRRYDIQIAIHDVELVGHASAANGQPRQRGKQPAAAS